MCVRRVRYQYHSSTAMQNWAQVARISLAALCTPDEIGVHFSSSPKFLINSTVTPAPLLLSRSLCKVYHHVCTASSVWVSDLGAPEYWDHCSSTFILPQFPLLLPFSSILSSPIYLVIHLLGLREMTCERIPDWKCQFKSYDWVTFP